MAFDTARHDLILWLKEYVVYYFISDKNTGVYVLLYILTLCEFGNVWEQKRLVRERMIVHGS